jgi:transposase
LGVDDFAWKKGRRYGTILIDLEPHQVVDLLPDQEADTLVAWLQAHPGVEVISRDRAGAYADGARRGAPQAIQVCDRFHLLLNLQKALTRLFERTADRLERIAAESRLAPTSPPPDPPGEDPSGASREAQPLSIQGQQRQARRERRKSGYEEVLALHAQGASQVAIATLLQLHRETLRRYLRAPTFPEIGRSRRRSKLDPDKAYLQEQWEAGEHTITHLITALQARAYRGSATIVYEALRPWRTEEPWRAAYQQKRQCHPRRDGSASRSAREAAWLFVCPPEQLTLRQVWHLEPLRTKDEVFGQAYELVQDFRTMVTKRQGDVLPRWLQEVRDSRIPELCSLAAGIYRDYDAVRPALGLEYSNEPTEGHGLRLKLIKRQAYGRAHFDLLRLRVLHGSGVSHQHKRA